MTAHHIYVCVSTREPSASTKQRGTQQVAPRLLVKSHAIPLPSLAEGLWVLLLSLGPKAVVNADLLEESSRDQNTVYHVCALTPRRPLSPKQCNPCAPKVPGTNLRHPDGFTPCSPLVCTLPSACYVMVLGRFRERITSRKFGGL